MKLENEEKCTYCREYGNLPCDECNKKLEEKKAMSKTKFTKVSVEERLPEEIDTNTVFLTKEGNVRIFYNKKYLKDYEPNYEEDEPEYFLEESPDREDEMIEMLRKIEDKLNDFHNDLAKSVIDMEVYNQLSSDLLKIKSLLQSLKQEK